MLIVSSDRHIVLDHSLDPRFCRADQASVLGVVTDTQDRFGTLIWHKATSSYPLVSPMIDWAYAATHLSGICQAVDRPLYTA